MITNFVEWHRRATKAYANLVQSHRGIRLQLQTESVGSTAHAWEHPSPLCSQTTEVVVACVFRWHASDSVSRMHALPIFCKLDSMRPAFPKESLHTLGHRIKRADMVY